MDKTSRWSFLNPIYWFVFVWWAGKQARKRTYGHGLWPSIFTYPMGVLTSVAAAAASAHHLGWENDYGWYVWAPVCLLAALGTGGLIWPWAYSLADIFSDPFRRIASGIAKNVAPAIVGALKVLPGAGSLWDKVNNKERSSWFTNVTYFVGYAASVLLTAKIAWSVAFWAWGLNDSYFGGFNAFGLGYIAVGFIVTTVFGIIAGALWKTVEDGKLEAVGIAAGGVVGWSVYALAPFGFVGALAAGAASFVFFTAYIFPGLNVLLTERLKRFFEWIKPLMESVYDAKESDYRLFFHHCVNVVAALGLGWGAWWLSGSFGLPALAAYAIGALITALSYLGVISCIKHTGGNGIISFFLSAGAAVKAGLCYAAYVGFLSWVGAGLTAILVGVVFFCLINTGLYRVLQFMLEGITAGGGARLDSWNKSARESFKGISKAFEKAYNATYHDKTEFRAFAGHILNLVLTAAIVYAGIHFGGLYYGLTLVALFSYIIFGHYAKEDGCEAILVCASVVGAAHLGVLSFNAIPWAWYFAGPAALAIAILSGYAIGLFILPPVYAGVRWLGLKLPGAPSWMGSFGLILDEIHEAVWQRYERFIWGPLKSMFAGLAEFLAPYVVAIAKRWASMMEKLDKLFGRGK